MRLFTFTTEAQRAQRDRFFVCLEVPANKKLFRPIRGVCWPKAQEFMENRYLPILHENISLSVFRVSNEPLSSKGEWVVKKEISRWYATKQRI